MQLPGEAAGLAALDELVVHGWDLARATGQRYAPDEAALEAAQSFLSQFASPDAPGRPSGGIRPVPAAGW